MKLHQYQIVALKQFNAHRNIKYICPRQGGSTTLGMFYAFTQATLDKNVIFVTLNNNMTKHTFDDFCKMFEVHKHPNIHSNKKTHQVTIGNAYVKFISQDQLELLRGRTFQTIIADNFDLYTVKNQYDTFSTSSCCNTELKLIISGEYIIDLPNNEQGYAISNSLNRCHTIVTRMNEIIKPTHFTLETHKLITNIIPKVIELL